jgi:hypothetical protein
MINELREQTNYFAEHPSMLEKSAGKFLSGQYGGSIFTGLSREDIIESKRLARAFLAKPKTTPQPDSALPFLVERKDEIDGTIVYKYTSSTSLTPEELDAIVHVDNISFKRGQTWCKQNTIGEWTYSISVMPLIKNFYSTEELKSRLRDLFPQVDAVHLPTVSKVSEKALVILISDDHAGATNTQTSFGNSWTPASYKERLLKLAQDIIDLNQTFEEVHILSLGDQMNGWNSQTTRGGHEVKSLSNKDQFDIYTSARKAFYDIIFASKISEEYFVHDMENSNHSGSGMSYIANQYLNMYLEAKFPQVNQESVNGVFGGFDYGIHTVVFTHGKDEEYMKRPFPLIVDAKTDLFMFQLLTTKGYNPTDKGRTITLYKGDLHQFNVQKAKFGRYVNIPSIMGSSDYSELNFGNTDAGAVLEIYERDKKGVTTKLVDL